MPSRTISTVAQLVALLHDRDKKTLRKEHLDYLELQLKRHNCAMTEALRRELEEDRGDGVRYPPD